MTIIGISGKAQAGKDTVAQYIRELRPNYPVYRLAFADLLKQEIFEQVLKPEGLDYAVLNNSATKESYRPLMQWWGTWRREQDSTYWIKKLEKKIEELPTHHCIVCITDVRYMNEAFWLAKEEAHLIRVNRKWPLSVRLKRQLDPQYIQSSRHLSETDLDDCHFKVVLNNDGSLLDLKYKVRDMLRNLSV